MSSTAGIEATRTRLPAITRRTLLLGVLLALIGMNLSTVLPEWGIDSSFRLLLTEATLEQRQFGVDLIWPYGPLGFLGGPTLLSRGLLALAMAYQFAVLVVLFTAVLVHLASLGIPRWKIFAALAPMALAISITDNLVPEVAGVAVVMGLLALWNRGSFEQWATTWPCLSVAGIAAGSLILVKFGPGGLACAVVSLVAMMSTQRRRALPVALAGILAGFLAAWLITGQDIANLVEYFRTELEVVGGYQQAQAYSPYGRKVTGIGVFALLVIATGVAVGYRWMRAERKAWQVLLPLALATWFVAKQSFIRWDAWHVIGGLLLIALLVTMLRWEKRAHLVLLGILLVSGLGAIAAEPSRLFSTWSYRLDSIIAVVSSDYQATRLADARGELRTEYAVPARVVEALAGGTVHAEPWDINALWAYDLERSVLPTPQSYASYTAELDRLNAERYASAQGPDGVLFSPGSTVDTRYGLWESPAARVALTCNFVPVAAGDTWIALRRAPSTCGAARELGTARAAPGVAIGVPAPSNPDSIVVAHFTLPADPLGQLTSAILRPLKYPHVTVDDTRYRLVPGTAEAAHIVRSPGRTGARELPHGAIAHSRLQFDNVGTGDVLVRFEEIPLIAP